MKFRLLYITLIFLGFNIFAQNWQIVGRMPFPVSGGRAIVKDSLIYIIGGYSDSLHSRVSFIQEFNPRTNSWRLVGEMKTKRSGLTVVRHQDSLLIFGGASNNTGFKNVLESWKFGSNTNEIKTNTNFNRLFASSCLYNNRFYLIGGQSQSSPQDTSIHNIVGFNLPLLPLSFFSDTIFSVSNMPVQQMSVMIDSSIYLFGGVNFNILRGIYRFDLVQRKLNFVQNMPKGRAGGEAVYFDSIKKVYLIGGYNEQLKALNLVEVYFYYGSSFTTQIVSSLNYARREFMAVRYQNSIYVFGGLNSYDITVPYIEKLDVLTDINEFEENNSKKFILYDNFPNPFNPSTTISFQLNKKSKVSLDVYSILGEHIENLVNAELEAGNYHYSWQARTKNSRELAGGIYLYSLTTSEARQTKKMILIK